MKKTFLYVIAGVFTFLIGLGIVYYIAFSPSYDLSTGKNVCQKCLDVSNTENIETKTLSEIVSDKSFYGKKVRLAARINHDAGYLYFSDDKVRGVRGVPAGFDKNAVSCSDTEKTFRVCTGYKNWYDSSVNVTVVGYLGKIDGKINDFQGGEEGFNIVCIERVNATDEELKRSKIAFETDFYTDLLLNRK